MRAACRLIGEIDGALEDPLRDAETLYGFIAVARWPDPDFGEREEVLSACAFQGWRRARRAGELDIESRWSIRFGGLVAQHAQEMLVGLHAPAGPTHKVSRNVGATSATRLHLTDAETILAVCHFLERRMENAPGAVFEEARFLYEFVRDCEPANFSLDEREYYLGQFALQAGSACRFLSRREEARDWFDRAEAWFLLTSNAIGDIGRLSYQRLALKVEERKLQEVLETAKPLAESYLRSNSKELWLKCRFLYGQVLKETAQLEEALEVFREILKESSAVGNTRLAALASVDIVQLHASLGQTEEALRMATETEPLLHDNRIGLAKLRWGLANLLRTRGEFAQAIQVYRSAQFEFARLSMRGDSAAISLVIADLLLESEQEAQAEWEIRAALPVIDELKMVPEGVAALSLLRESVRRRKIDRQALRDLHGYFDEIQG